VGLLTGTVLAWWLGGAAIRRLARTGPELLQLMRTGRTTGGAATADGRPGAFDALGEREKRKLVVQSLAGSVALFPQALVPIGIKLDGSDSKVWFLALYLPDAWQWPVIAAMLVLGVGLYVAAARTYLRARRRTAEPAPA
jgi:ABC-2 type transport system permease protein